MITVTEVSKRYGDADILRGVSLHVGRGEVCAILGPSGGGKSTLLRIINGLEAFDQGEVQVGDLVLRPQGAGLRDAELRAVRRRVGMVFQQFNLFPHRTVLENVIEAPVHVLRKPRDQAVAHARALLERVGLREKIHARPATLSGGQQQRAAIARALAMEPEVMLFDEPTSALDPQMTGEVMRVVTDLARSGQTMIVVTHALDFARGVAHTVHVMHDGRVAESGPPDRVLDSPQNDVTRALLKQGR